MDMFDILEMIGGLCLFLFGMNIMGQALEKSAGGKLRTLLAKMTGTKMAGFLTGLGITAIIQSSSATTVMVVGFVNSGLMSLKQAINVIMGANIGTTVTAWILSLSGISSDVLWVQLLRPSSFTPILALIGITMYLFSRSTRKKDVGLILLGFTTLMFGMETMSSSVSGLASNPSFTSLMTAFANPILGMAVGAVLTAVIQSSSASVGILQALCVTGAVNYSVAIPIIMGQNIGTCVTSIISAIGASKNAKRAAMVHLYFNLIGTIIFMVVFFGLNAFIHFEFLENAANPAGIAVIHSLFNIGATIILFPFTDKLVKLAEITIPDRKGDGAGSNKTKRGVAIDERFLDRPAFAIAQCKSKAREMAEHTKRAISLSLEVLLSYDEDKANEVIKLEKLVDKYEDALGTYLVKLSSKTLSTADSHSMSIILHSISDYERISDHAMDIVKSAEEINSKGLAFTPHARQEIETLCRAVNDICNMTVECFCNDDIDKATHVEPLEEVIDTLTRRIKENHINRLRKGKCTIEMGFILEDILTGIERVSDHFSNIAVEMITIVGNDYNTHGYFKNFSSEERQSFDAEYDRLLEEYSIG